MKFLKEKAVKYWDIDMEMSQKEQDALINYAKKNLTLEFRVESLKEARNDPWPLALYSWGMKK